MILLFLYGYALTLDVDQPEDDRLRPGPERHEPGVSGAVQRHPLLHAGRHGGKLPGRRIGARFRSSAGGPGDPPTLRARPRPRPPGPRPGAPGRQRFQHRDHRPELLGGNRRTLLHPHRRRAARHRTPRPAAGGSSPRLVQSGAAEQELHRPRPDRGHHDGDRRPPHVTHRRARVGAGHHGTTHRHPHPGARAAPGEAAPLCRHRLHRRRPLGARGDDGVRGALPG